MKNTKLLALIVAGTGLLACSPSPLTAPSGGASVNLAIKVVPHPGSFNLKAAPGQDRLDHYTFTLKQGVATIQGPTNQAVVASPISKTISNIATGNGYTIEVDGVDSNGASVTTGAAATAQFDVNGTNVYDTVGDPTHTTPLNTAVTPLAITLNMAAGALDPGPTVTVNDLAPAGGDKAGISLLNLLTWKSAGVLATDVSGGSYSFTISDVAQGATTGTSHQLFTYYVGGGQATVAKPQDVAGDDWGTIDTTTITKTFDVTQSPTLSGNDGGPGRIRTGGNGHMYFYNSGVGNFLAENNTLVIDISSGGFDVPILDPTVFAVVPINGNDTVYYFDPNDSIIKTNNDQGPITPTNVVDLSGNAPAPVITDMAADSSGAVYWIDAGDVYKLDDGETTFAEADEIVSTGLVTAIAVDAYGNLFYAATNQIFRSDFDGTNYAAGVVLVNTAGNVTNGSMSSDAAGNLYYLDTGFGVGNLRMLPKGNGATVYTVKGTAAVTITVPSVGFDGTLYYIDNLGQTYTM